MSTIDQKQLEEFFDIAPDDAREIGVDFAQITKVMRVGRLKPDGPLVYLGNIEILKYLDVPELIYYERRHTPEEMFIRARHDGRQRLVFSVEISPHDSVIKPGWEIIGAKYCYSSTLVQRSAFKKGSKKDRPYLLLDKRIRLKGKSYKETEHNGEPAILFNSISSMEDYADELPHDFWNKNLIELKTGKWSYGFELALTDAILTPSKPSWVYGICENFEATAKELFNTPEVAKLLLDTDKNDIDFANCRAYQGIRLFLQDDTITSSDHLMRLAIAQALAGPGPDKNEDDFLEEPVTKLVSYLYTKHLNNMNRREARAERHNVSYREEYELDD